MLSSESNCLRIKLDHPILMMDVVLPLKECFSFLDICMLAKVLDELCLTKFLCSGVSKPKFKCSLLVFKAKILEVVQSVCKHLGSIRRLSLMLDLPLVPNSEHFHCQLVFVHVIGDFSVDLEHAVRL